MVVALELLGIGNIQVLLELAAVEVVLALLWEPQVLIQLKVFLVAQAQVIGVTATPQVVAAVPEALEMPALFHRQVNLAMVELAGHQIFLVQLSITAEAAAAAAMETELTYALLETERMVAIRL